MMTRILVSCPRIMVLVTPQFPNHTTVVCREGPAPAHLCTTLQRLATQDVGCGPAASASPGSSLET